MTAALTNHVETQYGSGVSVEDDLVTEGEPEREFNPGIAARMPRKRVASGLLIRDHQERILFVDPAYKPFLDIPGGVADENESPTEACRREIQEELSIWLPVGRLLTVDWIPAHGVWTDGLMFIFDGGVLSVDEALSVRAKDDELIDVRFLTLSDASPRLKPSMRRRLETALAALELATPVYAEFGRAVGPNVTQRPRPSK